MKSLLLKFCIIFLLFFLYCSRPDKLTNSFTLKGKISGQDTGTIIFAIHNDSAVIYDTAVISEGEFVFKGNIDEPCTVELNGGNDSNRISFYIDPAEMSILLTRNNFSHYKLLGSKTNDDSKSIDSLSQDISRNIQSLREAYRKNSELLNDVQNESERGRLIAVNDSLEMKLKQEQEREFNIWLEFIKNHPGSHISPIYLIMLREREYISLDTVKSLISSLDDKVKIGLFGRQLARAIRIQENTQIGSYAPDFTAIDINNQQITLSQFKGKKVILIELWSSWCGPCRSGFPFLKSLFEKFNHKGFEIVAIANLDISQVTWKSAIQQEEIDDWYHIATVFQKEEALNKDILQDYPLGPIPMSFLVDKSGKIVARYEGHSEDNEKALEDKLKELLN